MARMMAPITYLSEEALTRKFGRRLRAPQAMKPSENIFEIESYLQYHGSSLVSRFNANSYPSISRSMDYFDLSAECDGELSTVFKGTPTRFCVVSFALDWLFPTACSCDIVHALNRVAASVSFVEIDSDKGHDAFLLEEPDFHRRLAGFLTGAAERAGLLTA